MEQIELFKIETGVPTPRTGKRSNLLAEDRLMKLTFAINNMKPGQSIVFDGVSGMTVRKHFKESFPNMIISIGVVDKVKHWYRLHLIEILKPLNGQPQPAKFVPVGQRPVGTH